MSNTDELNSVHNDAWDRMTFNSLAASSSKLEELETQGAELSKTFPPLMEDVFSSYFKFDPKVKAEVPDEIAFNKSLVEETMSTSEYANLRLATQLDEFNSAIATASSIRTLLEKLKDQPELNDALKKANELHDLKNQAEDLQDGIESLEELLKRKLKQKTRGKVMHKLLTAQEALTETNQAIQQVTPQVVQSSKQTKDAQRVVMRVALQQAIDDVESDEECCAAWGSEPGQYQRMPIGKRNELARLLERNEVLRKIASYAGRIKRIAFKKQETRIRQGSHEIDSICLGNDLTRILPSELMMLDSELEDEFYRKYFAGELLQYEFKQKENLGRGPIVICIDTSGSMRTSEREFWAKAVALAFSAIAMKEKRAFALVFFSSNSPTVFEFPEKVDRTLDLIPAMETFLNGGTNFEKPLTEAIDIINKSTFKRADIIFITDDECNVSDSFSEKFKKTKEEKGFNCFGIPVESKSDCLDKFCDRTFSVASMLDDEQTLGEVFDMDFSV